MEIRTEQDIIDSIRAREERPDLDYKADIDLSADNKKAKAEITKDIIAMANSGGGLIVGGVKEADQGYVLAGMSQDALAGFDSTALNDFVKNYCGPPINTTTQKVEIDGNVYGVIIVPEFAEQPHIVTRDYPDVFRTGDILVRSASNNSVRADPDELRRLINLAVGRRQGVLRDMLQAALGNERPVLVGAATMSAETMQAPFDRSEYSDKYKEFKIVTMARLDAQASVSRMALRRAAENAAVRNPADSQIFPSAQFYSAVERRLSIGIAFEDERPIRSGRLSFAFFGVNGEVFCASSLAEDTERNAADVGSIGLFSTILMMFGAVLFARQYYPALGYHGEVQVSYSQESSVPRALIMDSDFYWPFSKRHHNDMAIPITVECTIRTDTDLTSLEKVTKDMMIEFFWYFGLDLNHDEATEFLQYLKKSRLVRVPDDLLPKLGNPG